jgi:hypothetical protein
MVNAILVSVRNLNVQSESNQKETLEQGAYSMEIVNPTSAINIGVFPKPPGNKFSVMKPEFTVVPSPVLSANKGGSKCRLG